MKKIVKNISMLFLATGILSSCYKDLGNYDYTTLNDLEVTDLNSRYEVDQDEFLVITPQLKGTQYQDTSLFTYQWEISRNIVYNYKDLNLKVGIGIGEHLGRFMVTEKKNGAKAFFNFTLRVSSTTAGDLILVLSKQDGHAELSYKRLDKESDFVTNYYEQRHEEVLGVDPMGIYMNYNFFANHVPFGFPATRGGLQVLFKDQWKILNKNEMGPNKEVSVINGATFASFVPPYPIPDISNFKPEFINYQVDMWNFNPYGGINQSGKLLMISSGALYTDVMNSYGKTVYINQKPEDNGYLSPALCYAYVRNDPQNSASLKMKGYQVGSYVLLFDQVNGRFMYSNSGSAPRKIQTKELVEYLPLFKGYKMIYATHTANSNKCVAVLSNGEHSKLVYLHVPSDAASQLLTPFAIEGEVNVSLDLINANTKFYNMRYTPYILFNTNDKLYRYNALNILSKQQPDQVIANLSSMGYGADASIKTFTVSRTEKNILLAVSRYGQDTNGAGKTLKGDVVKLLFNSSSIEAQLDKKFEAVSGVPVDIQIKYQNFLRDGLDKDDKLVDKI